MLQVPINAPPRASETSEGVVSYGQCADLLYHLDLLNFSGPSKFLSRLGWANYARHRWGTIRCASTSLPESVEGEENHFGSQKEAVEERHDIATLDRLLKIVSG